MHLIFDTETTGVPRNYKAPITDLQNWPRVVQIAWSLCDDAGSEVGWAEHIIRPDGFVIPNEAARIHGITTERALAEGIPLSTVLDLVAAAMEQAGVLIAHNIAFDEKVLGAEFLRAGRANPLERLPRRCTMTTTADLCRLPGLYGFKWPKLTELHQTLFGEGFEGAHQAISDVRACARCYHELRRRGTFA